MCVLEDILNNTLNNLRDSQESQQAQAGSVIADSSTRDLDVLTEEQALLISTPASSENLQLVLT